MLELHAIDEFLASFSQFALMRVYLCLHWCRATAQKTRRSPLLAFIIASTPLNKVYVCWLWQLDSLLPFSQRGLAVYPYAIWRSVQTKKNLIPYVSMDCLSLFLHKCSSNKVSTLRSHLLSALLFSLLSTSLHASTVASVSATQSTAQNFPILTFFYFSLIPPSFLSILHPHSLPFLTTYTTPCHDDPTRPFC